jgi:hypothetical protein
MGVHCLLKDSSNEGLCLGTSTVLGECNFGRQPAPDLTARLLLFSTQTGRLPEKVEPLQALREVSRGAVTHQVAYQTVQILLVFQRLLELGGELLLNLFESPAGGTESEFRNSLRGDQNPTSLLQVFQLDELFPRRGSILGESPIDAMSHLGIEDRLARLKHITSLSVPPMATGGQCRSNLFRLERFAALCGPRPRRKHPRLSRK